MSGLNLSAWALRHRSFMVYCMIAVTVAGLSSYFSLGRDEDPNFTFRTMVVQAFWPGATIDETLQQVTERIERKLQETKSLDFIRSYTTAGSTTIFVNLKGATPPSEVPDIWYEVRKNIGDIRHTLPAGVVGPGFNDDFGDTYGIIYGFTADGFTQRELRDYVEKVRSRLLGVPDVSKIDVLGAQDERIFVEFSTRHLAGLGIDRSQLIAALQQQNAVSPSGVVQTGDEKLSLRVSGGFDSEKDHSRRQRSRKRPAGPAARHRRDQTRPRRPAAAHVPRQRASGDRPGCRHAARRRRSGAGRKYLESDERSDRRSAGGHRADPGRQPAADRRTRHRRFHDVTVAGDRDHHGGQPGQPRPARGRRRRDLDSRSPSPSSSRSCRWRASICRGSRLAR